MRLLLDTHIVLWGVTDDPRLPAAARAAIQDPANEIVVSVVSAWEVAVKRTKGKLHAPIEIFGPLVDNGVSMLPVNLNHVLIAGHLPLHHGDPFDRLLIGQAWVEQLRIVTVDPAFEAYDADLLPLG